MAHSNNSVITGKFKGMLGEEIVFRDWDGKTVVAKAPKRKQADPTAKQAVIQDKFLIASKYARSVIQRADKTLATAYTAVLRPRQNVYSRALEDFMSAPVVKSIGTRNYKGIAGDKIAVLAIDDFRVVSLQVEIYTADGTLLEQGDAVQETDGLNWTYTGTIAGQSIENQVRSA